MRGCAIARGARVAGPTTAAGLEADRPAWLRFASPCAAPPSWCTETSSAPSCSPGTSTPGITDITPYWRPAPGRPAVVVVDALSWGGADDGLLDRWEDLPEWPQMLLRAVMFRLAVHALHPRSTPEALPAWPAPRIWSG